MNRSAVKIQERWGDELTSGTTKLMAISSQGRRSKTLRMVEKGLRWSSWGPRVVPPPEKQSWDYRMMRWRRSTREGTIYRTKWARANLTYLIAASVKSEDTQVDMVTVRTVIKGLCRRFDKKRSCWRYFTVRDFLVGPSAASSNGHIADGRIKWGCTLSGLGGWEILGVCERIGPRLFGFNGRLPNWED